MQRNNILERAEDTWLYRRLKYGLNRRLMHFLVTNVFAGKADLKVAELACGSGFGSHLIAQHPAVRKSVAMDISRELFDQSRHSEFKAQFILGDIYKMPFAPNSFDLTWNSSALEHFENPRNALQAMAELTKPGGYVFVGVPYRYGPLALYYLTPSPAMRTWLGRPYSVSELEDLVTSGRLLVRQRLVYFFRFFIGVLSQKKP